MLRAVSRVAARSALRPRAVSALRNVRLASTLKQDFDAMIPTLKAEIKDIKTKYGDRQLGTCTVEQAYGGARSVKCLVSETSLLDSEEGIRFRGLSIPECQEQLPSAKGGNEPLPEGLFWLLMTGKIPSAEQVAGLSAELRSRATVPAWVESLLKSLPKDLHPMSQFSIAIMALQKDSAFHKGYAEGMPKAKYGDAAFEDALTCIARLPRVAALIYRNVYHDGNTIDADPTLDWGANYAHMLGFSDPAFVELMRLYLTIHTDHEGGNVSAHTTHLVGSALSDPYLALAAGMNGLAGPLHGLANQEVLKWLQNFKQKVGAGDVTNEKIKEELWNTLNSGQVVPGYGHAVLRKTDPRFSCQREFAAKHIKNDEMVDLVAQLYEVAPGVLTEHGKTKNPWPNVDAHSGVLLQHYGLVQENYYTVMFGVSRALGVLASLCIDRGVGLPIERPKSQTTESIRALMEK